jgi:hypothetical protein
MCCQACPLNITIASDATAHGKATGTEPPARPVDRKAPIITKEQIEPARRGDHPRLSVSGPEFLGVPPTLNRPIWLMPPRFGQGIGGALVREILDWSFDPSHQIIPYEGPHQSTIQHAWDNLKPS